MEGSRVERRESGGRRRGVEEEEEEETRNWGEDVARLYSSTRLPCTPLLPK